MKTYGDNENNEVTRYLFVADFSRFENIPITNDDIGMLCFLFPLYTTYTS